MVLSFEEYHGLFVSSVLYQYFSRPDVPFCPERLAHVEASWRADGQSQSENFHSVPACLLVLSVYPWVPYFVGHQML